MMTRIFGIGRKASIERTTPDPFPGRPGWDLSPPASPPPPDMLMPPSIAVNRDYPPALHDLYPVPDPQSWTPDASKDAPRTQHRGFLARLAGVFRRTSLQHRPHSHSHCDTSAHSHRHSHSEGTCCSGTPHQDTETVLKATGKKSEDSDRISHLDLEKGPPEYQRFVLNIDGLKCGCCETGITRAVSRISAIRDHQVNVVLARLEIDLDINQITIDVAVQKLSTATGYTFEHDTGPNDQVLELVHPDPRAFDRKDLPNGIISVERQDPRKHFWTSARPRETDHSATETAAVQTSEKTLPVQKIDKDLNTQRQPCKARVHYDASVIGARDVYAFFRMKHDMMDLAPPPSHSSLELGAKQSRRALFWLLPALVFTIPVLVFAWAPMNHENLAYAHASLALASIVQIIAWIEFLPSALRSLWYSRILDMDLLISLSTTTAYAFSVVLYAFRSIGQPLDSDSFFETSTLLVTLILFGRVINEYARYRAAKAVSFRSLQADRALLIAESHARSPDPPAAEIDARLLQYGDKFKVPPHTRIVTDGTVYYGGSEVDESMLTGESVPVAKSVESEVHAGTMNGNGTLLVTLKSLPHENTVHKIAAMVEGAELTQPKIQALADRIAGWFVPVIAAIGSVVFLIWLLIDRYHNNSGWSDAVVRAITYAIATLIVSCPCAIGLAVPMVVLIAGGVAARYGIIFRDPQKLEVARGVTDVVFDKTGTLTTGFFSVLSAEYYGTSEHVVVKRILLGLLRDSKHPIALGVYHFLAKGTRMDDGPELAAMQVHSITSSPGCGISGLCTSRNFEVRAGSPDWLNFPVEDSNSSFLVVTIQGSLAAVFKLRDTPKPAAAAVITALKQRHITVHMISGDSQGAVDAVAHALDIPKRYTKSRCKPEGKRKYIQDIQEQLWKDKNRVVLFIGDGTNDAVALKQADVGVHMHSHHAGSDVAKQAADVVLLTDRLGDVLLALDIAQAAYRRIVANFVWSAVYNFGAVLLAAGAFAGIKEGGQEVKIPPQWAGLGELVSVLPVVVIAFQMRWRDYGRRWKGLEKEEVLDEREEAWKRAVEEREKRERDAKEEEKRAKKEATEATVERESEN
jgi:heavy metal translocating P-type ATPase